MHGSAGKCDVRGDAGERGAGRVDDDLGDGGYGGDGGFECAVFEIGSVVGDGSAGGVAVSAASFPGIVAVRGADRAGWVWVGEVDSAAGWWWRWGRIAGDA
jgi:hypothetical protein